MKWQDTPRLSHRPVPKRASCTGGKRGEDLNHVAGYFPKLDSFLKVCGGCSCEGTGKGDSVGTVESKD